MNKLQMGWIGILNSYVIDIPTIHSDKVFYFFSPNACGKEIEYSSDICVSRTL